MTKNNQTKGIEDEEMKNKKEDKSEQLNNDIVRKFDDVLETDEKVVMAFKPSKAKLYWSNIIRIVFPILLVAILAIVLMFIPTEDTTPSTDSNIVFIVIAAVLVVLAALNILFTALYYKHTFYVVTDKRLIIRTGIFGVDYKSLDLKNIGAADVYVSLLDKLLRKNTGSLKFGSNSSPITSSITFTFAHITDPYKVYKDLKGLIGKNAD